jgi:Mediator complex subunit 27
VSMVVNVKGKGVNLNFTITRRLLHGSIAYDADCAGESHESRAISQCLARRKPLTDLRFLLVSQAVILMHNVLIRITQDMIHSFKDLRTARCVKCNRLLDQRALLPTSRRQAEKNPTDKVIVGKVWEALHEVCL